MKELRVVVFNQTEAQANALGPWCLMETDIGQLLRALSYPVGAHHRPDERIYTVDGQPQRSLLLPLQHDLHWNAELAGQRALEQDEAEASLRTGRALQVLVYNGDSDCVRHYLLLPLAAPVSWLPPGVDGCWHPVEG